MGKIIGGRRDGDRSTKGIMERKKGVRDKNTKEMVPC
jgi:hypothetical protein